MIKDKNGNVYKLPGPNPIMQTQLPWDKTQITLINMKDDGGETVKDPHNPLKEFNKKVFDIGNIIKQESKSIPPQQFVEEIKEPPVEKPVEKPEPIIKPMTAEKPIPERIRQNTVKFHCVPVISEETVYGEKMLFEGVILLQEDLQFRFWTNVKLQKNTIVYPQIMDKRWWKIKGIESSRGGYVYNAVPSDLNPDFS